MNKPRVEGYRTTFKLALPMGLAFAGEQLLGFVDTVVAGHLGAPQLAATGLGNALFLSALILGLGTLSGLEPLTAQARGRGGDRQKGFAEQPRRHPAQMGGPALCNGTSE